MYKMYVPTHLIQILKKYRKHENVRLKGFYKNFKFKKKCLLDLQSIFSVNYQKNILCKCYLSKKYL